MVALVVIFSTLDSVLYLRPRRQMSWLMPLSGLSPEVSARVNWQTFPPNITFNEKVKEMVLQIPPPSVMIHLAAVIHLISRPQKLVRTDLLPLVYYLLTIP
jgi:hypothetical protein